MFCEIYVQSAAHITNDPRFIHLFYFQVFLNRSSIPYSPSPILDPRSSILDPYFPVNLEVLLIKIIVFSTTEVVTRSKVINAFKQ